MHVCPALRALPQATRLAVTARLASLSTIQGLLPPNSNTTGVSVLAAASMTILPKEGLPVKKMISHRSASSILFTSRLPSTIAIYSSGKVFRTISVSTRETFGTYGEGLSIVVQPADIEPTNGLSSN